MSLFVSGVAVCVSVCFLVGVCVGELFVCICLLVLVLVTAAASMLVLVSSDMSFSYVFMFESVSRVSKVSLILPVFKVFLGCLCECVCV